MAAVVEVKFWQGEGSPAVWEHERGKGYIHVGSVGAGGEGSRRVVSNGALGSAAVRQGRTCEVRPERLSGSWATHSGGYLRRRMDEGW